MNNYRIFETDEFIKKLEQLQKHDKDIIKRKLINYIYPQLKQEPHYGSNIKKLTGYKPDTGRYRTGDYRIFYIISKEEKIISILTIDNRKDAY